MTQESIVYSKITFILRNLNNYEKIKKYAYEVRKYLVDWTIEKKINESNMYRITSVLTPQSRSPTWQNYFINKYKCNKISAKKNMGDFERNGKYYEYKASGFNENGNLNIVQIRLWQKCDYIIQSISYDEVRTFLLSHKEMEKEVKLCNASSAHGTRKANKDNTNIELRFTLRKNTEEWKRWHDSYLIDPDKFFKKIT